MLREAAVLLKRHGQTRIQAAVGGNLQTCGHPSSVVSGATIRYSTLPSRCQSKRRQAPRLWLPEQAVFMEGGFTGQVSHAFIAANI